MLGNGTPFPPSEAPCAPAPACAVSDLAVASKERAGGTVHDDGGTAPVVATCVDNGRQRLLLWRACARATRGCGWRRRSWGAGATRAPLTTAAARHQSSPPVPTTGGSVCSCGARVRASREDADGGGAPGEREQRERGRSWRTTRQHSCGGCNGCRWRDPAGCAPCSGGRMAKHR